MIFAIIIIKKLIKNNFISNNNSNTNNYINNKYEYSADNIPEPINNITKKMK